MWNQWCTQPVVYTLDHDDIAATAIFGSNGVPNPYILYIDNDKRAGNGCDLLDTILLNQLANINTYISCQYTLVTHHLNSVVKKEYYHFVIE